MNCVWFELLCRIPLACLRLPLSRRHVERCPRCLRASESEEILPPVLVRGVRLPLDLDLRPLVRARINEPPALGMPARRPSRLGYAAAAATLLLAAGVWLVFLGRRGGMPPAAEPQAAMPQVRLCSAKIAEQPARVFQVQSRDPNRSIFWIAKGNPGS